jgi:hypothetical protein
MGISGFFAGHHLPPRSFSLERGRCSAGEVAESRVRRVTERQGRRGERLMIKLAASLPGVRLPAHVGMAVGQEAHRMHWFWRAVVSIIIGGLSTAPVFLVGAALSFGTWGSPQTVQMRIERVITISAWLISVSMTLVVYSRLTRHLGPHFLDSACQSCGQNLSVQLTGHCPGCGEPIPAPCPRCGYDLTGNTSGACPECGERI